MTEATVGRRMKKTTRKVGIPTIKASVSRSLRVRRL
jgi:hypothetical protein